MKRNKGMIIAFMTPAVVMFVLVFLYPIVRTVLMSFFKIEGITDAMSKWTFTGIDNYVKLANTTLFRMSMWNLVRINGKWYHVDLVWDDPVYPSDQSDRDGVVLHQHFLLSDRAIKKTGHTGFVTGKATDKRYDKKYWRKY